MADPKPFTIAQLFTDLVGRNVSCTQIAKPGARTVKQMYGVYIIKPKDSVAVIQADLPVLGSLGGAMLGLPPDSVKERLAEPALDESLRDAIHEILNIASTIVSTECRAIFRGMQTDASLLPEPAVSLLSDPIFRSYFNVAVDGFDGGLFSLFTPA